MLTTEREKEIRNLLLAQIDVLRKDNLALCEALNEAADIIDPRTNGGKSSKLVIALQYAQMTLEHAMELGHIGDGSTRDMALEAIKKVKDAMKL